MKGWKGLKPKKKNQKYVDLHLEKDGESKVIHLETSSMWKMAKTAKKLADLNRKGWQLIKCTGTDLDKVAFMNEIAGGHVPGPKEMLSHAGLPEMPRPLKKFFRKEEKSDGKEKQD